MQALASTDPTRFLVLPCTQGPQYSKELDWSRLHAVLQGFPEPVSLANTPNSSSSALGSNSQATKLPHGRMSKSAALKVSHRC